jgi:hypothetical protein
VKLLLIEVTSVSPKGGIEVLRILEIGKLLPQHG